VLDEELRRRAATIDEDVFHDRRQRERRELEHDRLVEVEGLPGHGGHGDCAAEHRCDGDGDDAPQANGSQCLDHGESPYGGPVERDKRGCSAWRLVDREVR